MKIGIIIAVARELKSFLDSEYQVETLVQDHREIYKTVINNNEVYAIRSGCGLIDSSSATQYLITKFNVEIIINFGVTGALKEELKVQDLFVVNAAISYGFDTSNIDPVKKHQFAEYEDEHIPLDIKLQKLAKSIKPDLKDCVVASGDQFITDLNEKFSLRDLGCDICDMEIAGIARTCLNNEVPCLSIKCISDTLYGDGKEFAENIHASANKAFQFIQQLLSTL